MKMEWEGWCVSRTITDGRTDADTDVVLERVSRHAGTKLLFNCKHRRYICLCNMTFGINVLMARVTFSTLTW